MNRENKITYIDPQATSTMAGGSNKEQLTQSKLSVDVLSGRFEEIAIARMVDAGISRSYRLQKVNKFAESTTRPLSLKDVSRVTGIANIKGSQERTKKLSNIREIFSVQPREKLSPERFREICEFVINNRTKPLFSQSDVADAVGLDPKHYSVDIKKVALQMGITPNRNSLSESEFASLTVGVDQKVYSRIYTFTDIAREIGIGKNRTQEIRQIALKLGITKARPKLTIEEYDLISQKAKKKLKKPRAKKQTQVIQATTKPNTEKGPKLHKIATEHIKNGKITLEELSRALYPDLTTDEASHKTIDMIARLRQRFPGNIGTSHGEKHIRTYFWDETGEQKGPKKRTVNKKGKIDQDSIKRSALKIASRESEIQEDETYETEESAPKKRFRGPDIVLTPWKPSYIK